MSIDDLVLPLTYRQLAAFTRNYGTLDKFATLCSNVDYWESQVARSESDRAYTEKRLAANRQERDECLAVLVELMQEMLNERA